MKRIAILAALLVAAPAFAQSYPGDDDSWQDDEAPAPQQGQDDYGYGNSNTQYGQPPQQQQPYGEPQYIPPPPGEAYGQPPPGPQAYGQPPPPQAGPTYSDFEGDPNLASAGIWIDSDYGRVWRPTRVERGWQPYLYGHWAWTNAGWAWISDEPFGWATYHYGRWAVLDDGGWAWLPGRVWAPAWVAWRYDDGYAAWCPLGPRSIVYDQPRRWVVIDNRHFLEPVHRYVVPWQRRREIIVRAQVYRGPRAGPPVVNIGRATGRQVRPLVITDGGSRRTEVNGGSVQFYRPRTAPVVVTRQPGYRAPPVQHQGPQPVQRQPEHVYVQPNRAPPPVVHNNAPPPVVHDNAAPPVVHNNAPPPVVHNNNLPPAPVVRNNAPPPVNRGEQPRTTQGTPGQPGRPQVVAPRQRPGQPPPRAEPPPQQQKAQPQPQQPQQRAAQPQTRPQQKATPRPRRDDDRR